jgi:hypothetical protein
VCGVLPPWRPRKSPTSDVGDVDGVPYILFITSKVVVLGTGLVSNDERDKFKDQAQASRPPARSRERARPRACPKLKALAAAAAAAAAAQGGSGDDPVADGDGAADVGDADAASPFMTKSVGVGKVSRVSCQSGGIHTGGTRT